MKQYKLNINNNNYEVTIKSSDAKTATVEVNGIDYKVKIDSIKSLKNPMFEKAATSEAMIPTANKAPIQSAPKSKKIETGAIKAPIPGLIKGLFVKVGDRVTVGQKIVVMEAMKMENIIESSLSGVISEILVGDGQNVDQEQVLMRIEE